MSSPVPHSTARTEILTRLPSQGFKNGTDGSIGIAVDPRRRNISEEGVQANVERLQHYKERLIVQPRKSRSSKKQAA